MKLLVSAFLLLALGYLATAEVLIPFQECSNFFLRNQPPTGPTGTQSKKICQKKAGSYEFATLYDTTLRIPIYSAYKFQSKGSCSRNTPWYIEPQLDDQNGDEEMNSEGSVNQNLRGKHQALNGDYPLTSYDKGLLVPVRHRNAQACSDATFTLTNVAPQNRIFNRGAWKSQKEKVSDELTNKCLNKGFNAYVVTGVVPGTNPVIKGRVNIPDYFWSAYCCVDNNNVHQLSGAFYGKNDITNKVTTTTVAGLNTWLGYSVFGNNC